MDNKFKRANDELLRKEITRLRARVEELEEALDRQCDNIAFVINHAQLYNWYDKLTNELEEDRAILTGKPAPQTEEG